MGKLGFGTMRLPVDVNGNIDDTLFSKMIDLYIENGFSYFDTAFGYMGQQSEVAIKQNLTSRYPRDRYVLADKITLSKLKKFETLDSFFNAQLERLGVEYIDIYLVHGLDAAKYEEAKSRHIFEFISELKNKGKIKYTGISFHDKADVLDKILIEQNDLDYVQLQVNYVDWKDELVQSEKCVEVACTHNKRIVVMEPLKGGLLASFNEMDREKVRLLGTEMTPASWGIRFAASQKHVDFVLSGMNSLQQIENNISYVKYFKPLNREEEELLLQIASEYKKKKYIQCTECRYCMDTCSRKIDIPVYLKLLNDIKRTDNKSVFYNSATYYESCSKSGNGPDRCVNCGLCESVCPQKLSIREYLEEVKRLLG